MKYLTNKILKTLYLLRNKHYLNMGKVVLTFVLGIIFFALIFQIFSIHKLRASMFRLTNHQVSTSLSDIRAECKKIADCKLLPGDILIRRYVTERTRVFDTLAHPYFTHTAFYLGNDKIVEAVGTERKKEDEIQIATLSKSDWFDEGVVSFAIIRPSYSVKTLGDVSDSLLQIANDPDYQFGLPKVGQKRTTCADLIFKQLIGEKVITVSNFPEIITPDYLFSITRNNPAIFYIVGYAMGK